jgi:hypothetical protein
VVARLTAKGKGPGPVINPSDDAPGGGPSAPSKEAVKALKKAFGKPDDPNIVKGKLGGGVIIDKTEQIGSGKGGGFQFNAGSPAEQLKKGGGPSGPPGGGGSDDDDDKGSNKPPTGSNFGPTELIDPLGPPIQGRQEKGTGTRALGSRAIHR